MHMSRFHKEVIDSASSPGRNRVPSAKVKPQKPFSYLLSVYFSWRVELLEHRLLANTSCHQSTGLTFSFSADLALTICFIDLIQKWRGQWVVRN